MRVTQWIAVVLAILTLPLFVLGLIDPLEGDLAMLAVAVMGLIIGGLSRVAPPKLLWIALVATVAFGAIVLGIAIAQMPGEMAPEPGGPEPTASNPMQWLALLNWVWRLGVVITAVGWVMWIVRLFRAARTTAPAG